MGEGNPLVAEPEERSPLSGTFLGYDGTMLVSDMVDGHWLAAGLDAVATGIDVAAAVSNPIGALLQAGLGWVMDHLEPLKGWLDDLTGNPELVRSYGGTWENVASKLEQVASTLRSQVAGDLGGMSGPAVEAYRSFAEELIGGLENTAKLASSTSSTFTKLGTIVDVVHGLVRDTLAGIIAWIISAVAELVFSFGLATPWIVEQVSTKVADGVATVGTKVHAVVESSEALKSVITKVDAGLEDAERALDKIHPGLGGAPRHVRGEGEAPSNLVKPHEGEPHAGEPHEGGTSEGGATDGGTTDGAGGHDGSGSHDGSDTDGTTSDGPRHRAEPEHESVSERIKEDLTTVEGNAKTTAGEVAAANASTSRDADADRTPEPVG